MLRQLLCCLLLPAFLLGCNKTPAAGSGDSASAPASVTLALNWKPEPEFGGFYAAQVQHFYADHHLKVKIIGGGDQVPQMVAAGQCQFGILAADEVVTARSKNIDLVALFAVYQTNPQGIMTHATRNFKNIADVMDSSGTLAVQPGLPYVDFLRQKYPQAKVKIVPYDFSIVQFMVDPTYSQQCFITSEPIAAQRKGARTKVFLIADDGFNPYATVVVTRGAYLKSNPKIVHEFVVATALGWKSYLYDPRPANQAMEKLNPDLDPATFTAAAKAQKKLIENSDTKQHGLGTMTQARWDALIGQMMKLKLIDKPPAADECFVNP